MDMTWPVCRLCSASMKALRETWQLLETRWGWEGEKCSSFHFIWQRRLHYRKDYFCLRCVYFPFFYSRWILLVKLPSVWSSHIQNQLKIFKKNVLSWTKPGVVWENVLTNAKRSLEILMTCSVSSVILGKDSIPLLLSLSALLLEEYN